MIRLCYRKTPYIYFQTITLLKFLYETQRKYGKDMFFLLLKEDHYDKLHSFKIYWIRKSGKSWIITQSSISRITISWVKTLTVHKLIILDRKYVNEFEKKIA